MKTEWTIRRASGGDVDDLTSTLTLTRTLSCRRSSGVKVQGPATSTCGAASRTTSIATSERLAAFVRPEPTPAVFLQRAYWRHRGRNTTSRAVPGADHFLCWMALCGPAYEPVSARPCSYRDVYRRTVLGARCATSTALGGRCNAG